MKTALIIGINGNFGAAMAQALVNKGWHIKALLRDAAKAPSLVSQQGVIVGDAANEEQVRQASNGVDLIVYAVNPPYHRWSQLALKLLEPTLQVAQSEKIHVLFPGNVYNYAAQPSAITEITRQTEVTEKGKIRMAMEARLQKASQQGAQITVVRAGDFIGPDTHFSWLDFSVKQLKNSVKLSLPHGVEHTHFWSYLPDLAANTVKLVEQADWQYQVFNDVGLSLTTQDWLIAFEKNSTTVKKTYFPWLFFYIAAPFSPMIREVIKMRYLWRQPVLLSGDKLAKKLAGSLQRTPFKEVIENIYSSASTS